MFGIIGKAITSILIAYLSFTNSLATKVEHYIHSDNFRTDTERSEPTTEAIATTPSEKLILLSQMYAGGNVIPKVLKENAAFQEAAQNAVQSASVINAVTDTTPLDIRAMQSLVNIFCQYSTDAYTKTTTGTGFFINEHGVILTNAHVAQFLLLKDIGGKVKHAECTIRSGNPAIPRYTAELLFISPTWILHNAKVIAEEEPRGTGEYDYALLYVSSAVDNATLPSSFPTLPVNTELLPKSLTGASVLTAGYPAEKLLREGARAKLIPKVAETEIRELYTFGSNYADIFSITNSAVGEQGSSGGPIALKEKGAIGLIVTKGDERTEGTKSLRALTLSYIDRTIQEETGFSLLANTQGDLTHRSDVFKAALAPFLAQLLEYELR